MGRKKILGFILSLLLLLDVNIGLTNENKEAKENKEGKEHKEAKENKEGKWPKKGKGHKEGKGEHKEEKTSLTCSQALERLAEGNKRFINEQLIHPNQTQKRLNEVYKGQNPFVVVVSCSDSRVPPEIIFDQGVGDLFVIRTAGEVVKDIEIGSIEYAIEHLGVNLIIVLGHEKCGAVDATVKGGEVPGFIGSIVKEIKPAVNEAKTQEGDLLENSIKQNVKNIVEKISASEIVTELMEKKGVKIIGAYYHLDSGIVTKLSW